MLKKFAKVPPHVAIVAVLIALIGASGAALLLTKSEQKVEALVAPRAARIERVDGNVGIAHGLNDGAQSDWTDATLNAPLTVGDRIYAEDDSHAAVAFTGRNYARLNPGASVDVLSLSDRRTQLALRDGSAIFDIGELGDDELFEVATPNGAIGFNEPGLYQLGIGDNGNTTLSVLSGLAQVVGLAGTGEISKGEILTLAGQAATQLLLSKIAPDLAGNIVDDYYGYRYPNTYDGRYDDYDAYLDDPYYYDPYRQSASYRYVAEDIPGVYDLDRYGDWSDVEGYGHCWSPRVSSNWSPYRDGYWDVNNTWGPTWISEEPWGYAPYHYGRWAYINNQRWVWVPGDVVAQPVYSPALVAFIPMQQTNQIAWVPLAPGERYVPRYYDANFQPQYIASDEVIREFVTVQQSYANMNYPAAVTVIPEQYFTREIDPRVITTLNPQLIAQARPVIDPFAVDGFRQIALSDKEGWRRNRGPREIRREIFNTPVITSVEPVLPPVRDNMYQALQVQAVTDKERKRKLKLDDSGQVVAERKWNGLPQAPTRPSNLSPAAQERGQRIEALAAQAAQGDKSARREMRELKREQRKEVRTVREQGVAAQTGAQQNQDLNREQRREQKRLERAQRQAALPPDQQAQVAQSREQRKEQKRLERQQRETGLQQRQQQQQQVAAGQQREQRKLMKQQERAARAQRETAQQGQQQAQVNQQREQMKAQRRAERQQRAMVEDQQRHAAMKQSAQAAQYNQQREARKAQRQLERQQRDQQVLNQQRAIQQQDQQRKQTIMIQQAEKNREQRKMERRAAREQAAPQPQAQRPTAYQGPPVQQNQVDKSQRKAEREQRRAEKRKP